MSGPVSLRRRLDAGAGVLAALLAAAAVAAGVSLHQQQTARDRVLRQADPARLEGQLLLDAYVEEQAAVRGYVFTGDESYLQPYAAAASAAGPLRRRLGDSLGGDPARSRLLGGIDRATASWAAGFAAPAVAATRAGSRAYASAASQATGRTRFQAIRSSFAALDAQILGWRQAAVDDLGTSSKLLVGVLLAALVLLLALTAGASATLRAWVLRPLNRLGGQVRRVAAGELATAIEPSGPAELAALGADVEVMRRRIVDELHSVAATYAQLLEANERLEAANAELHRSNADLEQFAYVASHDLQEPLRKVVGFTELLQRRYGGQLDERADQYIAFATDGAVRMQVLISDLLAFSRVGRTTDSWVDVDLGEALGAALANLSGALEAAGAVVRAPPDLPVVRGDRSLLVALWQNMVGNAVKFRAEAPPVVDITCEAGADRWHLAVTDNGIGIEPRFAERVFVIFQRLHPKDQYPGTGIGLAMCRKIVEFHGGTIWVDTDRRAPGTSIHWTLPVAGGGDR